MKTKTTGFIKNILYALSSNIISLIISILFVLIFPKIIGIVDYGYLQLYLFYSSYIGFMHFGWNEGVYLRYGGEQYYNLDKKLFFSQFYMLLMLQIAIGFIVFLTSNIFIHNINKVFIIRMISLLLIISNVKYFLLYILQATNNFKSYAQIIVVEKMVYVFIITLFLLLGITNIKLLIIADLLSKSASLAYSMFLCKEIVFKKISTFYFSIAETMINITVGSKLILANIASLLIIGIVRFSIERTWDVATFGKVSLTLSISNLMMIFINAVGIIMFPLLRRTDKKKLPGIYCAMRDLLMVILLSLLLLYYPLKSAMAIWLPQYAQSLIYMALVFPVFIYEGKMSLLINTYLKTLRKEKTMLKLNVIMMILSLMITFINTQILNNLDITVFSIMLLLAIRSALAEFYLSKELNINIKKDIFLEFSLTIIFVLSGWFIDTWATILVYGFSYFVYLLIKRKEIYKTFVFMLNNLS